METEALPFRSAVERRVSPTYSGLAGIFNDRIEINPAKYNTVVNGGRSESQIDLFTGVQPDPGGPNYILESALFYHLVDMAGLS